MPRTTDRLLRYGPGQAHRARRLLGALTLLTVIGVVRVDLGAQATNAVLRVSTTVPAQTIRAGWADGRRITSVTGASDGNWTVVMSSRSGYESQTYRGPSSSWPQEFIRESWDADRDITEVAYCNDAWLVVTSGGTNFPRQRYNWSSTESLSTTMQEVRDLGYHITDVAYGGRRWVVVGSEVPSFGDDQVFTASSSLPSDFIRRNWDDGYHITEWYYGGGRWVVVMTKLTSSPRQEYGPWRSLEDARDEGREVLDIAYNGRSYMYVATENLGEASGFPPPSGGVLKSRVASSSSRSAKFTLDVFVVGSDSELLTLDRTDFSIADGELGSTGTDLDYTLTGVQRYRQRSAGPYSAMFLLDQSGSITGTDPTDARIDAAKVFIRNLGTGDEVGLMAFASGGQLKYSPTTTWLHGGQRFSSDRSAFFGALDSLADREGGGTPLYDATVNAVSATDRHANNTNQAVIVFTDGRNTSSTATLSSAIQHARQHRIPLHTVALSHGVDIGVLSEMAGETGGSLTYATDARRLISYYGALGPYLAGSGRFYRTTWSVLARGGSFSFNQGGSMYDYIEIEIPGSNIWLPFRLEF